MEVGPVRGLLRVGEFISPRVQTRQVGEEPKGPIPLPNSPQGERTLGAFATPLSFPGPANPCRYFRRGKGPVRVWTVRVPPPRSSEISRYRDVSSHLPRGLTLTFRVGLKTSS